MDQTINGRVLNDISSIRGDIQMYNANPIRQVTDIYSNDITRKIIALKNDIVTIGAYNSMINEQASKNHISIVNKNTQLNDLNEEIENSTSSVNYKQREVDTLRGRINNSKLVNNSRVSIYIIYIFITLVIIGGLVSMYWFPSNGRLNIFISIIAVLLLLLSYYQ